MSDLSSQFFNFNNAVSAIGAFAGSGGSVLSTLAAIGTSGLLNPNKPKPSETGGTLNALSKFAGGMQQGANLSKGINAGLSSNTLRQINDSLHTITSRIETTNSLLQKIIDIQTGVGDINFQKTIRRNNRLALLMSKTAMGRLTLAAMSKAANINVFEYENLTRGSVEKGVTTHQEIMTKKLIDMIPMFGSIMSGFNILSNKILQTKSEYTNESNLSLTQVIPNRLKAIVTLANYIYNTSQKINTNTENISDGVESVNSTLNVQNYTLEVIQNQSAIYFEKSNDFFTTTYEHYQLEKNYYQLNANFINDEKSYKKEILNDYFSKTLQYQTNVIMYLKMINDSTFKNIDDTTKIDVSRKIGELLTNKGQMRFTAGRVYGSKLNKGYNSTPELNESLDSFKELINKQKENQDENNKNTQKLFNQLTILANNEDKEEVFKRLSDILNETDMESLKDKREGLIREISTILPVILEKNKQPKNEKEIKEKYEEESKRDKDIRDAVVNSNKTVTDILKNTISVRATLINISTKLPQIGSRIASSIIKLMMGFGTARLLYKFISPLFGSNTSTSGIGGILGNTLGAKSTTAGLMNLGEYIKKGLNSITSTIKESSMLKDVKEWFLEIWNGTLWPKIKEYGIKALTYAIKIYSAATFIPKLIDNISSDLSLPMAKVGEAGGSIIKTNLSRFLFGTNIKGGLGSYGLWSQEIAKSDRFAGGIKGIWNGSGGILGLFFSIPRFLYNSFFNVLSRFRFTESLYNFLSKPTFLTKIIGNIPKLFTHILKNFNIYLMLFTLVKFAFNRWKDNLLKNLTDNEKEKISTGTLVRMFIVDTVKTIYNKLKSTIIWFWENGLSTLGNAITDIGKIISKIIFGTYSEKINNVVGRMVDWIVRIFDVIKTPFVYISEKLAWLYSTIIEWFGDRTANAIEDKNVKDAREAIEYSKKREEAKSQTIDPGKSKTQTWRDYVSDIWANILENIKGIGKKISNIIHIMDPDSIGVGFGGIQNLTRKLLSLIGYEKGVKKVQDIEKLSMNDFLLNFKTYLEENPQRNSRMSQLSNMIKNGTIRIDEFGNIFTTNENATIDNLPLAKILNQFGADFLKTDAGKKYWDILNINKDNTDSQIQEALAKLSTTSGVSILKIEEKKSDNEEVVIAINNSTTQLSNLNDNIKEKPKNNNKTIFHLMNEGIWKIKDNTDDKEAKNILEKNKSLEATSKLFQPIKTWKREEDYNIGFNDGVVNDIKLQHLKSKTENVALENLNNIRLNYELALSELNNATNSSEKKQLEKDIEELRGNETIRTHFKSFNITSDMIDANELENNINEFIEAHGLNNIIPFEFKPSKSLERLINKKVENLSNNELEIYNIKKKKELLNYFNTYLTNIQNEIPKKIKEKEESINRILQPYQQKVNDLGYQIKDQIHNNNDLRHISNTGFTIGETSNALKHAIESRQRNISNSDEEVRRGYSISRFTYNNIINDLTPFNQSTEKYISATTDDIKNNAFNELNSIISNFKNNIDIKSINDSIKVKDFKDIIKNKLFESIKLNDFYGNEYENSFLRKNEILNMILSSYNYKDNSTIDKEKINELINIIKNSFSLMYYTNPSFSMGLKSIIGDNDNVDIYSLLDDVLKDQEFNKDIPNVEELKILRSNGYFNPTNIFLFSFREVLKRLLTNDKYLNILKDNNSSNKLIVDFIDLYSNLGGIYGREAYNLRYNTFQNKYINGATIERNRKKEEITNRYDEFLTYLYGLTGTSSKKNNNGKIELSKFSDNIDTYPIQKYNELMESGDNPLDILLDSSTWQEYYKNGWKDYKGQKPWSKYIYEAAKKYNVDPELISAMIMQESKGDTYIVSDAGARGLMQIMPDTAEGLGLKVDSKYKKDVKNKPRGKRVATPKYGYPNLLDERSNPYSNIFAGTKYISNLIKQFDGNIIDALRAYNWGPGNEKSYLKNGTGAKGQSIPNEARNYPSKVLSHYGKHYFTDPNMPINPNISSNINSNSFIKNYDIPFSNKTNMSNSEIEENVKKYLTFSNSEIDFKNVNPELQRRVINYAIDFNNKYPNKKVKITSAFRSIEKQRDLYNAYKAGRSKYPAAQPGHSRHNYGFAVDMSVNSGSIDTDLLEKNGLIQPYPVKDPVHIEGIEWAGKPLSFFKNYTPNEFDSSSNDSATNAIKRELTNVDKVFQEAGTLEDIQSKDTFSRLRGFINTINYYDQMGDNPLDVKLSGKPNFYNTTRYFNPYNSIYEVGDNSLDILSSFIPNISSNKNKVVGKTKRVVNGIFKNNQLDLVTSILPDISFLKSLALENAGIKVLEKQKTIDDKHNEELIDAINKQTNSFNNLKNTNSQEMLIMFKTFMEMMKNMQSINLNNSNSTIIENNSSIMSNSTSSNSSGNSNNSNNNFSTNNMSLAALYC